MHILIVSQYFWPESFKINDLAQGLLERGHKVTVLTGLPNYPGGSYFEGYSVASSGEEWWNGIRVIRAPIAARGRDSSWRLILNYFSFAVSASVFGVLRCRDDYDVIFAFEPSPVTVALPAILLRALGKIPFLFWVQDLWPESLTAARSIQSPRVLKAVRSLVDFIYRHSDRILIQSPGFEPHVRAAGLSANRIRYLPNWAEENFKPIPVDPKFAAKQGLPDGFVVMFAGNIGASQDFQTIVSAAERLQGEKDVQWVIVGDGDKRSWLQDEIQRRGLGNSVHLIGRKPLDSMPEFFANADVLLVSLRDEPVFSTTIPSKVQAYLACGRPMVAALSGSGADVVRAADVGFVVCPGDDEQLASAVRECARMPKEELERFGANGRSYYLENFERNMLIDRLNIWMTEQKEIGLCVS